MNNMEFYFHPSVTWSKISSGGFSTRYIPQGFIFDVAGCSIFCSDILKYLLAFTNSNVATSILKAISQTINFEVEQIKKLPIIIAHKETVDRLANFSVNESKADWDALETSWDFKRHPLV